MAITYGMSVKEFWEDDPELFWAYRFSYFTNLKNQQEAFNHEAWLQGAYICEAVQVAIARCFGKSEIKYMDKPFSKDNEISFEEKQKNEIEKIKARVMQVQAIIGQKEPKH